jgi:response regulator RpfG family c-di-GMP phosphodiesterase
VANASGRDRGLSETPRSSKVYRSSGGSGYGQSPHGRVLIIEPEASLRPLLREVLELEGYDVVEAAHSYEGLQAADVALPEGVTLDIRYLSVW